MVHTSIMVKGNTNKAASTENAMTDFNAAAKWNQMSIKDRANLLNGSDLGMVGFNFYNLTASSQRIIMARMNG